MGIPKNTFLTKKRLDDAKETLNLEAKREARKGDLTGKINREINDSLPERGLRPALAGRDPYYGYSGDLPEPKDEALVRAKAEANLQRYGFDKEDPSARAAERAVQNLRDAKENQKEYGMKKGGKVRTASQRADGCAIRGKTRA